MSSNSSFRSPSSWAGLALALLAGGGACSESSSGPGPGGAIGGASASGGRAEPTGGTTHAGGGGQVGGGAGSGGSAAAGGGASSSGSGGGAASGGALSGGGASSSGGIAGTGGALPTGAGGSGGAAVAPSLENLSRLVVSQNGLTIVSYGGYLNGESFQQDGIASFGDYQYAAFWNKARHVVLVRRRLTETTFTTLEFTDYTNKEDDAHNTISLGLCPEDGTLHLAFDHHNSPLHYRRSLSGLLNGEVAFSTESFDGVKSSLTGTTAVSPLTYPRFVTSPDGKSMLLSARLGESGSGDEHLWEYSGNSGQWVTLGKYIDGQSGSENPYPHGLAFGPDGRLSIAWCTRATPDATTNHDLYFMWSPDGGRTWSNDSGVNVAEAGTSAVKTSSDSVRVWQIGQNRGLINQEHMTVDPSGGVHVLLSHMPDGEANDSDFTRARTKSEYFHYYRAVGEKWVRHALNADALENFRGKLAIAPSGNVYAVLPNLRLFGAAPDANYENWKFMPATPATSFFSDPLVDVTQISRGKLSIFAPLQGSAELDIVEFDAK